MDRSEPDGQHPIGQLADTDVFGRLHGQPEVGSTERGVNAQRGPEPSGEDVADASSSRFCGQDSIQSSHDGQWNNSPQKQGGETKQGVIKSGCEMGNANSKRLGITQEKREHARSVKTIAGASWWAVEPNVGRVVDGVAHRVDRLKAIGNGQVPAVVREAWRILIGGV
jgi:DNA (cytosine-5)-methyltransferase 1